MNVEAKVWVQTLALKPGDLLMVKIQVPTGMDPNAMRPYFEDVKVKLREALDEAGWEDTQILICANNIDLSVLPAVEALGLLASGIKVSADQDGS